jgi:hypothetical protein
VLVVVSVVAVVATVPLPSVRTPPKPTLPPPVSDEVAVVAELEDTELMPAIAIADSLTVKVVGIETV